MGATSLKVSYQAGFARFTLLDDLQHIQILACGTSWHASLVGKYLLEQVSGIPTFVQYASEFRYAPAPMMPHTLTIGVTQSGETADTLAALEMEQNRRAAKRASELVKMTLRLGCWGLRTGWIARWVG